MKDDNENIPGRHRFNHGDQEERFGPLEAENPWGMRLLVLWTLGVVCAILWRWLP